MEEDKMFSISHWGMFEYEPKKLPSKVASQFVGGWPYGRYAKIEEVIEKVNSQLDLKA